MSNQQQNPDAQDNSLDKIRQLIVGRDDKYVKDVVSRDAKVIVTDVVSEALHERENADGSVNKVLVPLVEKSLHRSIEANSEKIVGTLYPLVGTLVRKAVSSFLVDFVERTNALIENSFSPKSVSWRFKAWQSGVKYADFVASQVYQYQVQQLFVIHRETGTLLHTMSTDPDRSKDADLISSMLVAINDFVADAFQPTGNEAENELGEIKTGDFTLLIKIGPQAILVAAVVGSVPPEIRSKLQQTLEEFHQFYQKPLLEYEGDNSAFEGCETLLNDCLISQKKESEGGKKKHLVGALVLGAVLIILMFLAFLRIELSILQNTIRSLTPPAGIVITDTAIENGKVQVRMLRDPSILTAPRWLENEGIALNDVVLYEEPFVSLQASVVEEKLNRLLSVYPAVTSRIDEKNNLKFSGNLPLGALTQFTRELNAIPGILQLKPDLSGISITAGEAMNNKVLKEALMAELAAQVSAVKIDFATNQQALAPSQTQTLEDLTLLLKQLQDVAQQLNLTFAVFVMGASDNSGTPTRNLELSRARAKNVSEALINMGINEDVLFPIGLGQVSLQEASMGRTVFINVLVSQRSSNEGETP